MKTLREKYLRNMLNNQFLKIKNRVLEPKKDLMQLKARELKGREEKIEDRRTIL